MNHSNSSLRNTTEAPPGGSNVTGLLQVKIGVLSVILYLALFGNIFVLVVLKLRKQKLSRMQWFVVHLSITDILVALCNVMPQLIRDINGRFIGDDFSCRLVKYLQVVVMYASSYVLLMTAIDRYASICHPLTSHTMTPNRGHLMVLAAWIISLVFSIPQLIIFRYMYLDNWGWDCSSHLGLTEDWMYQAYITWNFLSTYVIPFFILAFCYGRICHVVWRSARSTTSTGSSRRSQSTKGPMWRISFKKNESNCVNYNEGDMLQRNSNNPRGHSKTMSKSKMKTIKVTLMVVVCYLVCWGPFYVAQMWWAYDADAPISTWAFRIILLLASLNSCTNPWIFLAYSGSMCKKVDKGRRISRSWTASTHLASTYETDSRSRSTRSSYYDISQRSSRDLSGSASRDVISTC